MQSEQNLISVREFCGYHQIDVTFVQTLEQQGLIQIVTWEQSLYVRPDELPRLEKMVRLHQDLDIHPDDLDVVNELLERIETLQDRVTHLQNRLVFYQS